MFLYQSDKNAIRILGCRSYDGEVIIPETIDGKPVTELAPYAFSEGWGRREMLAAAGSEIFLADSEGNPLPVHQPEAGESEAGASQMELPLPPPACCGHLTEIILPKTIKKIGNYAFYNCFELKSIRCYSSIADVGSGLFTGCTGVRNLDIHIVKGQKSCFKELISELRQELYVNYYSDEGQAKLIFPEMYEESVENTPARIIVREMHGCGHRYRYCFEQTDFRFQKYDELFPHILVQEPESVTAALVMGRLRFPVGLMEKYREVYETYLREHFAGAAKAAIRERKAETATGEEFGATAGPVSAQEMQLPYWLADRYGDTRERLDTVIELANEEKLPELLSFLMDLKHRRFAVKKRTFSL